MSGIAKVKGALVSALDFVDEIAARISLATLGDASSLVIPYFHGIYPGEAWARSTQYFPQQGMTLEQFRNLLTSFQQAGFGFIGPEELPGGDATGKCVLLTFDDGYANNLAVLPLLHEFKAPAVFFISTGHVQTGKAFWWDVLYRHTVGTGRSKAEFEAASRRCKTMRNHEIEEWLRAEFGADALQPCGDLDRPMTPAELAALAKDEYARIGNHTLDHAILTNYSPAEVREQIEGAQDALREMTGISPDCIAYPSGNWSAEILEMAQQAGLQTGLTTAPGRNRLPVDGNGTARMRLKRSLPWGERDMAAQCRMFRSGFSLRNALVHARARTLAGRS